MQQIDWDDEYLTVPGDYECPPIGGDLLDEVEIWRAIPGYEGYLEVSSLGRIKSLARVVTKRHSSGAIMRQQYRERILRASTNSDGYVFAHVGVDGRKQHIAVHRAVLMAFVGSQPDGMEACHNNGNASDNRLVNLRWDTHLGNSRDRIKHGTYKAGQSHPMAKITAADAIAIYGSNETCKALAERYGIAFSKISEIRRGVIWRSVTGGKPRSMPKRQRANEKLTQDLADGAREMRRRGASLKEIAERFGISVSTASQVCSGRTWRAA